MTLHAQSVKFAVHIVHVCFIQGRYQEAIKCKCLVHQKKKKKLQMSQSQKIVVYQVGCSSSSLRGS